MTSADIDQTDIMVLVREIVADVLEMDLAEIANDALFYDDLSIDSLEKVEITARLERAFRITLSAEEAAAIRSISDATEFLRGRRPTTTGRIDLVARLAGVHVAAGRGDRVAYSDPDVGDISYTRLYGAARGYAGALRAAGVPSGIRGLVVADDSVATVVAVLGLWWHGCVPVPVSPMLSDAEVRFIADDCHAAVVHLDAAPVRQLALKSLFASTSLLTGDQVRKHLLGAAAEEPHGERLETEQPTTHARRDEVLVQYTSGSTGVTKGVLQSAVGLMAVIDGGLAEMAGLLANDVILSTARMSFGYGFGSSMLCPLAVGARVVVLRGTVDVQTVSAALARHRPTVLCSVPRMYTALLNAAEQAADRVDATTPLASIRLCLSAGEHCPAHLSERVQRAFGASFMNCLGATEVGHVVVATPPEQPMPGAIGVAVPGVTATVRDDDGLPVPDGVAGRLHIVAPSVALGYLDRPDETVATFADQGAYTGDIVCRSSDGVFEYLCRADSILNLGGYKVVPREIEDVVRGVDGVLDAAVVGGADEEGLQQAVLFAVPGPDADRDHLRRAVLRALRAKLAVFKRPARVEFVNALPTTSTGKLANYKLRERTRRS